MSEWRETEIGLIPSDWKISQLNKYIKNKRGICYGVVQPGFHDETGIPIIRVNNIKNGRITVDEVLRISLEIESKYRRSRLEGNEILITLVGSVGEIAIVSPAYKNWNVARAVGVLPVDDNINKNWLKYWLQSSSVTNYINSHCNTTVQITLNLKDVANLPIVEPSLQEQKKIADVLSCLDAKIENLRSQNQTLEKIAQTLFNHWFIDFEFPNDSGKPYKSSGGAMVTSELGDIPDGWRIGKLGDTATITSSKRIFSAEYVQSGIPFYRSKEIIELQNGQNVTTDLYISLEKFNEIKSKFEVPKTGEILLTSVGTIGIPYLIRRNNEFYFKDGNLTWIKKFVDGFSGVFIYNWLKSDQTQIKIKQNTIGSTQKALTIQALGNISILIPSQEVLKKYTSFIEVSNSKVEHNIFEIQTLTKTRDTLLPKLMSGQIRVTE